MNADMFNLIPCAVVVDTQNVKGQFRKAFGHNKLPTATGIRETLKEYGFEAKSIYAGVATRVVNAHQGKELKSEMETNRNYAKSLRADGVEVLEGLLAYRNNSPEEKQVDVLLALAIAELADQISRSESELQCVIVLSEDMDLVPAHKFAEKRKVSVYAMSNDVVYFRKDQPNWLILHEEALAKICEAEPSALTLRSWLAATIASRSPSAWNRRNATTDEVEVDNVSKIKGYLPRQLVRGKSHFSYSNLWIAGARVASTKKPFPQFLLSAQPPANLPTDVVRARVLYWENPTHVRVRIKSTSISVYVGAASVCQNDTLFVLQQVDHTSGATKTTYIGPEAQSQKPVVGVAEIVSSRAHYYTAKMVGLNETVLIAKSYLGDLPRGSRCLVALIGRDNDTKLPVAQPLSSALPVK